MQISTWNGSDFTRKFFATLRTHLGKRHLTTTSFHAHTNKQLKQYLKTILTRPRHYISNPQLNWDIIVQPLKRVTNAYNIQVHGFTDTALFIHVLIDSPPGPATISGNSAFSSDTYYLTEPQALPARLFARINTLHAQKNSRLNPMQNRYKRGYDKKIRRNPPFTPRKQVYICKPTLVAPSAKDADRMYAATHKKNVCQRQRRTLWVNENIEHTLTINENGVNNTVSIQLTTLSTG